MTKVKATTFSDDMRNQFVKYTVVQRVYFTNGGAYSEAIEAPTRIQLLKKMRESANKYRESADLVTFGSIKRIVETSEPKGKSVRFKIIRNDMWSGGNERLNKFYTKLKL